MLKRLLYLVAFLGFVLLATFLAGNKVLAYAVRQQLTRLPEVTASLGLELADPAFQSLKITSTRSLEFRNIALRFRPTTKEHFDTSTTYMLRINELRISATDHSYKTLVLEAEGVQINTREVPSSDLSPAGVLARLGSVQLQGRQIRTTFASDPSDPGAGLRVHLLQLAEYLTKAKSPVEIEFNGETTFRINRRAVQVPVVTVQEGDGWILVLKKDVLESLLSQLKEQFTELEVDLMVSHPLRAPILVAAKQHVEQRVDELPPPRKGQPSVAPDTYRYILWGYLVTKLVGPEFAQKVTEAHHLGSSIRTSQQRQSDKENTALGRRYAMENVQEKELLELAIKEGSVGSARTSWSVR